jgi:branched-subunit amino acid transport protein
VSRDLWIWLAILGVSATTLLTRCSFLVLGERANLPPIVEQALRYAPGAALAALIGPELLTQGGSVYVGLANAKLLAAIAAAATFLATRSMVGTIVVGMAAFTALRLWG